MMECARKVVKELLEDEQAEKWLFNGSVIEMKRQGLLHRAPAHPTERVDRWKRLYFDLCYDYLSRMPSERSLKIVKSDVKQRRYGWDSCLFEDLRMAQEEEDAFLANPIEVEEGVVSCGKCKSNKTYSYQLQTRSGDEGITTFVTCASCGARWRM